MCDAYDCVKDAPHRLAVEDAKEPDPKGTAVCQER